MRVEKVGSIWRLQEGVEVAKPKPWKTRLYNYQARLLCCSFPVTTVTIGRRLHQAFWPRSQQKRITRLGNPNPGPLNRGGLTFTPGNPLLATLHLLRENHCPLHKTRLIGYDTESMRLVVPLPMLESRQELPRCAQASLRRQLQAFNGPLAHGRDALTMLAKLVASLRAQLLVHLFLFPCNTKTQSTSPIQKKTFRLTTLSRIRDRPPWPQPDPSDSSPSTRLPSGPRG